MKLNASFLLTAAGSTLLAAAAAHADGVVPPAGDAAAGRSINQGDTRGRAVYQGTDSKGRSVQLAITDVGVPTFVRISDHTPDLHWTSKIGTGQAASLER
jgi:hypothetical protein